MVFIFKALQINIDDSHSHNGHRWNEYKKTHGKKWMRITPETSPMSDNVRAWYWGAVIPTVRAKLTEWENLTEEEVHEVLKKEFNGFDYFSPITKKVERVGRSAVGSDSNTRRAMEYIEKIRVWLAEEYMTELPSPAEYMRILNSAKLR